MIIIIIVAVLSPMTGFGRINPAQLSTWPAPSTYHGWERNSFMRSVFWMSRYGGASLSRSYHRQYPSTRLSHGHVAVDSIGRSINPGRWFLFGKPSTWWCRNITELAAYIAMDPRLLKCVKWLFLTLLRWSSLEKPPPPPCMGTDVVDDHPVIQ